MTTTFKDAADTVKDATGATVQAIADLVGETREWIDDANLPSLPELSRRKQPRRSMTLRVVGTVVSGVLVTAVVAGVVRSRLQRSGPMVPASTATVTPDTTVTPDSTVDETSAKAAKPA